MSSYLSGVRPKTLESATQESEATLDYLDRPQQALTGLLSEGTSGAIKGFLGQEKYDGLDSIIKSKGGEVPEGMAYEAASLAYDVLADPTNLIGGALVKGFDMLEGGARKGRGMLTGSSPNVISDFYSLNPEKAFPTGYNPAKVKKAIAAGEEVPKQAKDAYEAWSRTNTALHIVEKMGTKVDKLPEGYKDKILKVVDKIPAKIKGTVAELQASKDPDVKKQADVMLGAYFKTKGFAEWAGESVANVFSTVFSSTSKAAYKDTGLTTANKKRVEKAFGAGDNTGVKTGVAQLQHAAYMAHRRGRTDLPPVLQETMDQMSIGGFQKLDPSKYEELSGTVQKQVRGQDYTTPADVTGSLLKQATKNWGVGLTDNATMVVRQPRGFSGDFVSDANRKSKAVTAGRRIFSERPQGFDSVLDLKKAYEKKGFDNVKMTPTGVIITGSAASNSYLEGGINIVTHIDLKGVGNVIISDMYDFLEKVPVIKKIEQMMEEDIIGVTPPITVDLLGTTGKAVNTRTVPENIDKLKEMTGVAEASAQTLEKATMKEGLGAGMLAREANEEE